MRRHSIGTLMASVLLAAVGLAALRKADQLWVGMVLLAALTAVGAAVLGVLILRGKERWWWAGFALFGGGYLALAVGPWLSDTSQPRLGATLLLDQLRGRLFPPAVLPLTDSEVQSLKFRAGGLESSLANVKRLVRDGANPAVLAISKELEAIRGQLAANEGAGPQPEQFRQVGHALLALLAGLLGGMIAGWFSARRERAEAASGQA